MPRWAGFAAIAIGILVSIGLGAEAARFQWHSDDQVRWLKIVGVFWAVAPPIWFFLEWWLYPGPVEGPAFESFKRHRQLGGPLPRLREQIGVSSRVG
jgi:hypothetical protein